MPSDTPAPNAATIPLCVDLDGTLLHTDTMAESMLMLLKEKPLALFCLPWWLRKGMAGFKQVIASQVDLPADTLPVHTELVDYLREQHTAGRKLLLVSGTDLKIARAIGARYEFFDEVCASDGRANISGHGKAHLLVERFGRAGFDYAGNAQVDLVVWAAGRKSIVVSNSRRLIRQAEALGEVEKVFAPPGAGLRIWMRALRIHRWMKNLLVFVPLLVAQEWHNSAKLLATGTAFFAFSLCAASAYVLNDLFDLEADRLHPAKRHRPFAGGNLSILWGVVAAPLLLIASLLVALLLPWAFVITLALYYFLTLAYSLRLKKVKFLAVLTLAGLYAMRVLAGGFAAQVAVSAWLLVCSLFVFLGLAFIKRSTELQRLPPGKSDRLRGRG